MSKSTHTGKYKKLVAALREARRARDITQVELSKKLRKPQSYVAKFEQAERRLDIVEFLAIVEALDMDGVQLLKSVGLLDA